MNLRGAGASDTRQPCGMMQERTGKMRGKSVQSPYKSAKADSRFLIARGFCKAHGEGEGDLCVFDTGHEGPHHFLDCRGALYELVDGSAVPFAGIAR
jgi:hypothetical protein